MNATIDRMMKTTEAATILQRSVCLSLECHYLGNNRQIDLGEVVEAAGGTVTFDAEQFHVVERLVDRKELREATRAVNEAKHYLQTRAIAAHRIFGQRTYLVPVVSIEEIEAWLTRQEAIVRQKAAAVAARYDMAAVAQRAALGPLASTKYPTAAEVAAAYSIDWVYVSFAAPDRLTTVNRAIAERARVRYEGKLRNAFDVTVATLHQSAVEVMRDLEQRLAPGADGKPRVIRGTALRDLEEFAAHLPARNLTDDQQLAAIVARVAARTTGLDVGTLRQSDALRADLHQAAVAARAQLEELIETVGRRAIRLPGAAV